MATTAILSLKLFTIHYSLFTIHYLNLRAVEFSLVHDHNLIESLLWDCAEGLLKSFPLPVNHRPPDPAVAAFVPHQARRLRHVKQEGDNRHLTPPGDLTQHPSRLWQQRGAVRHSEPAVTQPHLNDGVEEFEGVS